MEYTFGLDINEGEIATVEADNLEQAKKNFSDMFPEAVNKIIVITSENGYEEFR